MTEPVRKTNFSSFRFYEKAVPDLDDLVMVKVKSVGDSAAYVWLIEYDHLEGMVPFTELSRRRIRSISKHIKVGSVEVMTVIRVDKARGYVDLSKKRVSESDMRQCEERYTRAKMVHGILQSTVQRNPKYSTEELYKVVGWPLYSRYGHAYDGFKVALSSPEKVISVIGLTVESEPIFRSLMEEVKHRMKASAFRIRAEVEVTLYTPEGIRGIKEVFAKAEMLEIDQDSTIKVHVVAAPHYTVRTQMMDKAEGIALVQKAVDLITEGMEEKGGECVVRSPPQVMEEDDIASPTTNQRDQDESDEESE